VQVEKLMRRTFFASCHASASLRLYYVGFAGIVPA